MSQDIGRDRSGAGCSLVASACAGRQPRTGRRSAAPTIPASPRRRTAGVVGRHLVAQHRLEGDCSGARTFQPDCLGRSHLRDHSSAGASGTPTVIIGASDKAGIDSAKDMVSHTWHLMAFDKASGKVLWDKAVHQGVPRMKRHVKASHASATPATDGGSIVALFGSEGLFCFDTNGNLKWRQDLGLMDVGLVDDPGYQWGPASPPTIFGNLVIVGMWSSSRFLAVVTAFTSETSWVSLL